MEYARLTPSPDLADVVEHYWVAVAPDPPGEVRAVLIPNGRSTVQFCLATAGYRCAAGASRAEINADVFLPATEKPYVITQRGASHYVGVQFTPTGARALWPQAPAVPELVRSVARTEPTKQSLASDPKVALDEWLRSESRRARSGRSERQGRALAASAAAMIDADPPAVSVSELASALGVSPATLYRAFVRWVGVSPKAYASIRRFFAFTSGLLHRVGGDTQAMLAAARGYADESHAAREFRRHTGVSPTEFRDRLDGIALLMFGPSESE